MRTVVKVGVPTGHGRWACAVLASLVCVPGVLAAQAPPPLPVERAQAVVDAALAEVSRRGWRMSVAVTDAAGDLVAFGRSDGVAPVTVEIAVGKARTAARFRLPTGFLEDRVAEGQGGFLGVEGVVPLRGGVPLVVDGALVGAVGVSGRSGEEDEAVARSAAAWVQAAGRGALLPGVWALTNVQVVPMTSDTVLRDAVVLVRHGIVAAVGRAGAVDVPDGVRTVDGGGGWVVPGLADMHAHLYSDYDLPDSLAPAELGVMLANGVTAVRLMAGTPEQLELRDAVRRGDVLGPQIWAAGPMLANEPGDNTRVVTSSADARAAVREVVRDGYDFVKVTFGITGDAYDALVDEARASGIRVVGHVEPEVGIPRALAAGQEMEHLDAFFEGALADSAAGRSSLTQFGVYRPESWESLRHLDMDKLDDLARATAASGVWVGPTLEVFNRAFGDPLSDEALRALPDWRFIPEEMRARYVTSRQRYWAQPVPREDRRRYAELRNRVVKTIHDAGGRLIAGSDTPDLLMAYGFTLHRELQAMVDAGLSPWEALRTATRNPAEFLGELDAFGTIEAGRRADLVLLAADPRADIAATRTIRGVSVGGRWLEPAELDAMLEAGRRAIAGETEDGTR